MNKFISKSGFVVAEDCIAEGKQNFKTVQSNTKISKEKLQEAQSMIALGLDRKCKLESEIKDLENEKASITKK